MIYLIYFASQVFRIMFCRRSVLAVCALVLSLDSVASPVSPERYKTLVSEIQNDICYLAGHEGFLDTSKGFATFQPSEHSVIVQQFHSTTRVGGMSPELIVHQLDATRTFSSPLKQLEWDNQGYL